MLLLTCAAAVAACSSNPPPAGAPPPSGGGRPCDAAWVADLQLGGALGDEALAIAAGPGDRLLVAGYRDGVLGVENVEPTGDARAWIAAVAPTGAIEWERTLDTAGADTFEALALDGGAALVVGRTTGALTGFTHAGQQDLLLARVPLAAGPIEVLRQDGTVRPEHPRSVSAAGGFAFTAGWYDVYVPDGGSGVERWEDELTAAWRLGEGGGATLEWLRTGTLDGTDLASSVWAVPDAPGDHVVSGAIATGTERGPFVRRVRADGSIAWSRRLTTVPGDSALALAGGPDGDVLVAGSTYAELAGRNHGQQDAYVLSLDAATGETRWGFQHGSAESDWVTAIAVEARGHVVIAGETLGDVTGETPNAGMYDAFVYLVAGDGTLLGSWQRGSPDDEQVHGVAIDRCGRVFVAGATRGALAAQSAGSKDLYVVRAEPAPRP